MGRVPCCEKNNGLKKGPWTSEEDQKLIDYIQKNGYRNWRTLPKNAGLQRCGKSCRLRWTNYLRPDIKRGKFSFDEEETIIQLHSALGNKWSTIAAHLPGRTDNEIKNYWNTHIRKRLLRMGIDPVTHNPRLDLSSILSSSLCHSSPMSLSRVQPLVNPEMLRLAASLLSSQNDQNPNSLQQIDQRNHFANTLLVQDNQLPVQDQTLVQELPNCASWWTSSCVAPFSSETFKHMKPDMDQISSSISDFKPQTCQSNAIFPCNNPDSFVTLDNYGHNMDRQSDFNNNFSFASGFLDSSTPSPSSTPMNSNSNSTYTREEDREMSYCSNLFKYEIQELLNVNVLM